MACVTRSCCPRICYASVTECEVSQIGHVFGITRLCSVRNAETENRRVKPQTRGVFGRVVRVGKYGGRRLSKDCDGLVALVRGRLLQRVDQDQCMLAFPEIAPKIFSIA